ncbi:MAG: DUF488 family protein [Anaeromyxobacteraceae bacterium]
MAVIENLSTAGDAMVRIKRAYEGPANVDGYRVLVDRLWPRGVKKEALRGPHASPRFRRRLARAPPTRAGERCPRALR